MHPDLADLLSRQSGVISRGQALDLGLAPHDLRRHLRRRELAPVHPGVFVDHTGDPTWVQRAWAGVLLAWPAALCDESAIRAADGPGRRGRDDEVIHVAVERHRHLAVPAGVVIHRVAGLQVKARWNASPPSLRLEYAVLRVAARAVDDFAAVQQLADAVQSRRTTPQRLAAALVRTPRLPRRVFLAAVLQDLAEGACSVLEHGYLTRVERPHGLPVAQRQVRASLRGPVYRDVVYEEQTQVVEIDGRHFHDTAASRARDLERDLDAAVAGSATVRLGWSQVFRTSCATAHRIGALLNQRGWTGRTHRCPECP